VPQVATRDSTLSNSGAPQLKKMFVLRRILNPQSSPPSFSAKGSACPTGWA
jgi:hypothetical protein